MSVQELIKNNKTPVALLVGTVIIAGAIYFSNSPSQPTPSQFVPTQGVNRVKLRAQLPSVSNPGCLIKGNINSQGGRIYHLPGCGSYEKTVITESKGERWFCTEDEAVVAGWRKAKNCPY